MFIAIRAEVKVDGVTPFSLSEAGVTASNLIFDTEWLSYNTLLGNSNGAAYVFYFEIPVNAGEFCLGNDTNTNGTEGAYLLYLDIGANGSDAKDGIYSYNITTLSESRTCPLGVDFAVVGATGEGGQSICVYIDSESSGALSFNVNNAGTDINITDSNSISVYAFKSGSFDESYTVSGNSPGDMEDSETLIERISYIRVVTISNIVYDIEIVDTLEYDSSDELVITETKYYVGGEQLVDTETETPIQQLQRLVPTLTTTVINEIRNRSVVIILDRIEGTYPIDAALAAMPWSEIAGSTTHEFSYDIRIDGEGSLTIAVTIVNIGTESEPIYVVATINTTSVENGDQYEYNP